MSAATRKATIGTRFVTTTSLVRFGVGHRFPDEFSTIGMIPSSFNQVSSPAGEAKAQRGQGLSRPFRGEVDANNRIRNSSIDRAQGMFSRSSLHQIIAVGVSLATRFLRRHRLGRGRRRYVRPLTICPAVFAIWKGRKLSRSEAKTERIG